MRVVDQRSGQPQGRYRRSLLRSKPPAAGGGLPNKESQVRNQPLRNGTPSKLEEFEKLAQQTNLINRMGFWQVYADVIVVADAREQNAEAQSTGKLIFQGLSSELRSLLDSAVSSAIPLFDSRIGIGVMEFIQTMDSEPFTAGTHGLHVRRFCEPAPQSEELRPRRHIDALETIRILELGQEPR
jgi:hypothetical protein